MDMRKLHLFTLTAGMLCYLGAGAQNATGTQPLPKPKPPVQQQGGAPQRPTPPAPQGQRHTPPGAAAQQPQGVLKPGPKAGPLLDSVALSKEPVFTGMDEASKNPSKVYKLVLFGEVKIPDGLEKFSNLQVLELTGPPPQRPMMPQQRGDMPDDVPPPPMPMMPPAMPNGKGSEITPGILTLVNLTELHIHNYGITKVPAEIAKLGNLKVLDLNSNPVNSLPETIAQLKSLRELRLDDAMMPSLPAGITGLTNLRILEVGVNAIPEIKSLTDLYITSRNPNLPTGLEKLPNLRLVCIASAMLQPAAIKDITTKLQNVKEISIPNAFMKWEDFAEFGKLRMLQSLEVSGVFATKTMGHVTGFDGLKTLKIMNVYGQSEQDFRNLYQMILSLPSKPALTIKYRKSCEEFFTGQKEISLYINDPKITPESLLPLQPRGLILGSAFTMLPSKILNLPNLQELDISKMQCRDYNELPATLSKMRGLKKLTISSDALRFLMPAVNEMKSLDVLTIKATTTVGPQGDGRDKAMLYKSLPRTKIVFID